MGEFALDSSHNVDRWGAPRLVWQELLRPDAARTPAPPCPKHPQTLQVNGKRRHGQRLSEGIGHHDPPRFLEVLLSGFPKAGVHATRPGISIPGSSDHTTLPPRYRTRLGGKPRGPWSRARWSRSCWSRARWSRNCRSRVGWSRAPCKRWRSAREQSLRSRRTHGVLLTTGSGWSGTLAAALAGAGAGTHAAKPSSNIPSKAFDIRPPSWSRRVIVAPYRLW
jgi:hypothetical protein